MPSHPLFTQVRVSRSHRALLEEMADKERRSLRVQLDILIEKQYREAFPGIDLKEKLQEVKEPA